MTDTIGASKNIIKITTTPVNTKTFSDLFDCYTETRQTKHGFSHRHLFAHEALLRHSFRRTDLTLEEAETRYAALLAVIRTMNPTLGMKRKFIEQIRKNNEKTERNRRL